MKSERKQGRTYYYYMAMKHRSTLAKISEFPEVPENYHAVGRNRRRKKRREGFLGT